MAYLASGSVVRQIGSLFESGSVTGLSDRQLLERFNDHRDAIGEAAFAALVSRHGPMVLDVCHQILGDLHHAEDAFQAVFLVLARRARSIHDPDLLANWVYGVAVRTARCAKHGIDRRRKKEADAMRRPNADLAAVVGPMVRSAEQLTIDREQAEALHDEIERLPNSFRLPVVLCYFEGLTLDEAARQLCCPAGTVGSRLARARDKLRRGLTRRGVVLPAAALTAALAPRSVSASISSSLTDITTRAAIKFAVGQATARAGAASAAALAQEVLRTMLINKLRFLALAFLFVGAVATGAGWVGQPAVRQAGKPDRHKVAAEPEDMNRKPGPGRMFVVGRVLDPNGKALVGTPIDIVGRPRAPWVATSLDGDRHRLLGLGSTDRDGRFRLDTSRTSSDGFFEVYALAAAPGFGLGWAQLNADANQPAAEIRLRPEQVIHGRLVDLNGQPASGVKLRVQSIGLPNDLGRHEGVMFWDEPTESLRAWPRSVKTDDRGHFAISGIGRGLEVRLDVRDPRFARQLLGFATTDREPAKIVTRALEPATIIAGRALAADTGGPIAGAVIAVAAGRGKLGGMVTTKFRADDQGRFTANPFPGDYFHVNAFAPAGQPYLVPEVEFAWTKGAVTKVIDITLPRGVLIRGKVIEQGTGRSLAGASVQYIAINRPDRVLGGWQAMAASNDSGSFEIVVPRGRGHLLVFGPTSDFILEVIGDDTLHRGQPGGTRNYAHRILAYEVKAGDQPHEVAAVLRPGKTVRGHLTGPEGQTVKDAAIITRLHIEAFNPSWRGDYQLHARDGSFELHGLDPETPVPVYFLDADHEWGAAVALSGKQAGDAVTIRLQPNGQAKARFVGPDGKPCANVFPQFYILATPGPPAFSRSEKDGRELAADAAFMANVDRKHYWGRQLHSTDADGRMTLPNLVPGALYRITDFSNQKKGIQIRRDFTVKPGETLNLGDILIEKPEQ